MWLKLKVNHELHSEASAPPPDFKVVDVLNIWKNGTDHDHPIPKDWLSL